MKSIMIAWKTKEHGGASTVYERRTVWEALREWIQMVEQDQLTSIEIMVKED